MNKYPDKVLWAILLLYGLVLINYALLAITLDNFGNIRNALPEEKPKILNINDFTVYQGKIIAILCYEGSTLVSVELDEFGSLLLTLPEGSITGSIGETYEVLIKNSKRGDGIR